MLFTKSGMLGYSLNEIQMAVFKVAEAAGRNWDVSYWSFLFSDLVKYTPRYYNDMEDNYNSQQPEL